MTTPLLKKLLNRTAQEEPLFCADERPVIPGDLLQQQGYLMPDGIADAVCCIGGHFADIVWMDTKHRGNIPFATCAECGIYEIEPQMLRRWKLRLEVLLERLAEKLELKGGVQTHFPKLLWRLGRKKAQDYFYVRRYLFSDRRVLRDELARMPKAILITGTDEMLEEIRFDHNHISFALECVAEFDEQCELAMNFDALNDILGELPQEKTSPQSAPRRGSREAKIKKLTQELERHIKDANDLAKVTGDQGRLEFLPCPTLEELAKRTKMNKMDVSRCLKDPNAKYLQLLWEKACHFQ